MTRSTTTLALQLAAREKGVTAEQLSEDANISLRGAQKALRALIGDHGMLGSMGRERLPNPTPGAPRWVYYLRKTT